MQTFLPYPDFESSARCLDDKRLGKQRIECVQILSALRYPFYGWQNHPATNMWRGFSGALASYGISVCKEWKRRGFHDKQQMMMRYLATSDDETLPPWIGDESFHLSHQSNLIRKLPEYYRRFFPNIPDNLPYVWPEVEL